MSIDQARKARCGKIIHSAATAAGAAGAGLAQLPCSDSAVITPVQLAMTISLGREFGIELTESSASAMALSYAGTQIGRIVSQILVGWIPGIGNAINAATAAALTEALGWSIANEFADRATR